MRAGPHCSTWGSNNIPLLLGFEAHGAFLWLWSWKSGGAGWWWHGRDWLQIRGTAFCSFFLQFFC